MLHRYTNQFLKYCGIADFSIRSIEALTARLNEVATFLKHIEFVPLKGFVSGI